MNSFSEHVFSRPAVFDGAMGTMIQRAGLTPDDFGGHPGVGEILNLTRPDVIASVHRAYLEAGADVIITNTFGASRVVLDEHGLGAQVSEINRAAARIAREAADAIGRPAFVAGELGPTSKLPSLGHIIYNDMEAAYTEQARALIEGGVDLIIISTSQDPLQVKAAASAARQVMRDMGMELPLVVSVTVESSGAMLVGSRLNAVLASVEPFEPFAFGINCALGPDLMEEYLAELMRISPVSIICQPNAGMPVSRDGRPHYPLKPDAFAGAMARYAERFGLGFIGGCCGTTPDHIKALAAAVSKLNAPPPRPAFRPSVSSLFSAVALDQEPRPLIVAEQTNANGSKKFRELVAAGDWDGCVAHARRAAEGAHVLDVSVALPGSDEVAAMHELVPRLAKAIDRPLMIDSTNPAAIEAALMHIGGRAIVNSINLEDGGAKAKKVIAIAKRFGAALMCLTIDEQGMATTAARKVEVAQRLVELACAGGLRASDLLIDPLVFTLASGDAATADAAKQTLASVGMIKKNVEGVFVSLGVSNVSFGLPVSGRKALNSYVLHRAVGEGLDVAIINARTIMPVDRIDESIKPWIERLVDNDLSHGNPLMRLIGLLTASEGMGPREVSASRPKLTPIEALSQKVVDGDKSDLNNLIGGIVKTMDPRDVVNDILMPAMKMVGERFGAGTMPLPFVLQSAETMRAAVDILAPYLQSDEAHKKGTIVLATVRGDVHDIGKNLVDAILSNNGFKVINIGIRQPAASVIDAVRAHGATAIGLSGLLVSSTEIMREDLEAFRHNGVSVPVLCGGAALTEQFTGDVLKPAYGADVYYCKDAFDGLKAMEKITS